MDSETIDAAARLLETAAFIAAVALGAWFVFGALACCAVRIAPHLRAAQTAIRWSPAIVRRFAGVACSASVALTPQLAHAAEHPAPAVAVEIQTRDAVIEDEPIVRAAVTPPAAPPTTTAPTEPAAPAATPPPSPGARTHIVERGDNLWQLARAELGGDRSSAEIAAYWRALVDANRPTLRSGNPNLIFPGEAITLPPTG